MREEGAWKEWKLHKFSLYVGSLLFLLNTKGVGGGVKILKKCNLTVPCNQAQKSTSCSKIACT